MPSFKDAAGRTWHLDLDTYTADEVKKHCDIDLIDAEKVLENIGTIASKGTRYLVEICWCIIEPQAIKAKVEPEDFGRSMKPQNVSEANKALQEAIIDFFRPLNPSAADAMRKLLDKAEKTVNLMGENELANLDQRLEKVFRDLTFADSSTNTQASSGLTPAA